MGDMRICRTVLWGVLLIVLSTSAPIDTAFSWTRVKGSISEGNSMTWAERHALYPHSNSFGAISADGRSLYLVHGWVYFGSTRMDSSLVYKLDILSNSISLVNPLFSTAIELNDPGCYESCQPDVMRPRARRSAVFWKTKRWFAVFGGLYTMTSGLDEYFLWNFSMASDTWAIVVARPSFPEYPSVYLGPCEQSGACWPNVRYAAASFVAEKANK